MNPINFRASAIALAAALVLAGCSGSDSGGSSMPPPPPPPPPPPVTTSIDVDMPGILAGNSFELTWSSNNATSCEAGGDDADNWAGSVATSGTETITPTIDGRLAYSVTCTGAGGNSSSSTQVAVITPPVAVTPPASFEVGPNISETGQRAGFDNFDHAFLPGGNVPENGAEIVVRSETLPPPPLSNFVAVELYNAGASSTPLESYTVDGVSCTQVTYTTSGVGEDVDTRVLFCPSGDTLFKFYLSYYTADLNSAQYNLDFEVMLDAVDFPV